MAAATEEKKGNGKAKAKTASREKSYDDYSLSDAESDGWVVTLKEEPRVLSASGVGGAAEIAITDGRWQAEKTADGHLITAFGTDEDSLAAAIGSQQASIDAAAPPELTPSGQGAGGEEGGGIGEVIPELKVNRDEAGNVEVVEP